MTSWRLHAACIGVDPDLFFTNSAAAKREAKGICYGCPVRRDCLEFAMRVEQPEPDEAPETNLKRRNGIYGGYTAYARWELRYPAAARLLRRKTADRRRLRKQTERRDNGLSTVPKGG